MSNNRNRYDRDLDDDYNSSRQGRRNLSDEYSREGNGNWRNGNSSRNTRNYGPPNIDWDDPYEDNRGGQNKRDYWRDKNRNYGLGDTSQGSANYGHPDNSSGSRYYGTGSLGGYYGGNDRHSHGRSGERGHDQRGDRDWWDRTTDEVASWFGDDDAERRRRRDKMEGPYKGKGPKGYVRSDEKIQDEINEKLYHDSYLDASDIEVSVKDGEATLTGTVTERSAKRRAEDQAERITGVHDVINSIKVNRTTTDNRSTNQDYNESTMI